MAYYMIQQQPTTVNPYEVLLNSEFGNASQSIPSSAYQTTVYGMLRELERQNNPDLCSSDKHTSSMILASKTFADNVLVSIH